MEATAHNCIVCLPPAQDLRHLAQLQGPGWIKCEVGTPAALLQMPALISVVFSVVPFCQSLAAPHLSHSCIVPSRLNPPPLFACPALSSLELQNVAALASGNKHDSMIASLEYMHPLQVAGNPK